MTSQGNFKKICFQGGSGDQLAHPKIFLKEYPFHMPFKGDTGICIQKPDNEVPIGGLFIQNQSPN